MRSDLRPPGNVGIIKRYISSLEGFDVTELYDTALSDKPLPDNIKLGTQEGAPGASADLPLAITVDDFPPSPLSLSSPDTPPLPMALPAASLTWWGESSPPGEQPHHPAPQQSSSVLPQTHHTVSASAPTIPTLSSGSPSPNPPVGGSPPLAQTARPPSLPTVTSRVHSSPGSSALPRWTLDAEGFAEPTLSPRRVDRVITSHQPPGWYSGRIQMIGKGLFMGKLGSTKGRGTKGDAGELTSGTVVRNGMRVWVDMRTMKVLTVKSGDNCEFVILM